MSEKKEKGTIKSPFNVSSCVNAIKNIGAIATLGWIVTDGVASVFKGEDYALTKTVVGVAGLGLYYRKVIEPSHKKFHRLLQKKFGENVLLNRGSILVLDSKFPTIEKVVSRRLRFCKHEFSMEGVQEHIKFNMNRVYSDILSGALMQNMINGKSVKESVLFSLEAVARYQAPSFFKGADVNHFIKNNELLSILVLKFCAVLYDDVLKCQNDEMVIDYLKNGFNNPHSIFYGVKNENLSVAFLNRNKYQNNKAKFSVLSGVEKVSFLSMAGLSAAASFSFSPEMMCAGLMSGAVCGGVYFYKQKQIENEMTRFFAKSFQLKTREIVSANEYGDENGSITWCESGAKLTKYRKAQLDLKVLDSVISYLDLTQKDASCKEYASLLFYSFLAKDKNLHQVYKMIEKGFSLEDVAKEKGLSKTYEFLKIYQFSMEMKNWGDKKISSYLFDLKYHYSDYKDRLALSRKKMPKGVNYKILFLDALKKSWNMSEADFKKEMNNILEKAEYTSVQLVPKGTILPKSILLALHRDASNEKE